MFPLTTGKHILICHILYIFRGGYNNKCYAGPELLCSCVAFHHHVRRSVCPDV